MKMKTLVLLAALGLVACGGDTTDPEGPTPAAEFLGPNEKADNFRSQSAQEYFVRGTSTITLGAEYEEATEEERVDAVTELVPYKQVVIGYFLNVYLIDKSSDADNAAYGGFKALTKNGSYQALDVRHLDGLTYEFDFEQEVGGDLDLLVQLANKADAEPQEDGSWRVDLTIGKISNEDIVRLETGNTWFRDSPWSGFNPDEVDAERLETQVLYLEPQERSDDAWIDYNRLIADGTVDVQIFMGWDYHGDYHIVHAEEAYEWLVREGFDSPVSQWDEYVDNRDYLTKTMNVGGQEVLYRVRIWWGQPGTETDPDTDEGGRLLEEKMIESLESDEVIIYSGHSGPWYGFALANWRKTAEGDLDDSEIPQINMPEKYQIVLAEGCDTYALGEAFWANPAKASQNNLDIVTTTSFSDAGSASTVTDFLKAIANDSGDGVLEPMKYSTLLEDLDSNSYWFETMYGVHGIDDNPKAHPFADRALLCGECGSDADCGQGGTCIGLDSGSVCTFECTADAGCGSGNVCRQTQSGGYLSTSYCVPESISCR